MYASHTSPSVSFPSLLIDISDISCETLYSLRFVFPLAFDVLCVCNDDDENDPAIYIEYDNKKALHRRRARPLEIMIV